MAEPFGNISGPWAQAGLFRRVMLLAIVLACVGATVFLVNWVRKPQMGLLYSNVGRAEAAKIVDTIRDADIKYELTNGGTTILVEEDKVYSLRLKMAGEGLPTGEQAGYRILDDESFGSSPFKQKINYKRALEGELAKSIQLINGVVHARVTIAKPEGKMFPDSKNAASASVILRLRSGKRMTSNNIAAIVHLIAGGVEGLDPKNVAVIDGTSGTLLSGGMEDDYAKSANTFFDHKTQVEDYLARKAEDMLAAALGPNKARVRVDAIIKTTSTMVSKETFGEKAVIRDESKTSSKTPQAGKGGGADVKKDSDENLSMEYQYPKTVEQKTTPPGEIILLKVAALVDLSVPKAGGEEGEETEEESATEVISLADAEQIIRNALGLDDKRGDTIKVVSASFPQLVVADGDEDAGGGMFSLGNILKILRQLSLGVLVIGALLMLKMFGGAKGAKGEATPELEAQGAAAGGGADRLLPGAVGGIAPEMLRARVTRALQENPEEVKKLFLSWVEGEKGEA